MRFLGGEGRNASPHRDDILSRTVLWDPFPLPNRDDLLKGGEGIKTPSGVGGRRRHSVGKAVQCNGPLNNAHGARNPSGELGCETRTFLVLNPDVDGRRGEKYSKYVIPDLKILKNHSAKCAFHPHNSYGARG